MIRLSIPLRQALARLTLPVLIAAAFGLLLIGKADALLAERARMILADALVPIYAALARPMAHVHAGIDNLRQMTTLFQDNARLREENERLRKWQAVALTLDAENIALKANLRWMPEPGADYVTARVVADAGGVYARAVLLSTGPNHSVAKGQIALDDRGLVGRVTEIGARSARVLLLTDMNSRVPVTLENSRARHADGHQRRPAAAAALAGGRAAGRGRAGGHQRRSQRLSRRPARRHRPLQRQPRARGGARRQAGPA